MYSSDWSHTIKQHLAKSRKNSVHPESYYDPNPTTPTILQCDASQVGLGAWLRQESNSTEKIVAMASRALTDTESRYSNIERMSGSSIWIGKV